MLIQPQQSSKGCPQVSWANHLTMFRRKSTGKRISLGAIASSPARSVNRVCPAPLATKFLRSNFFTIMHFGCFIFENIHRTINKKVCISCLLLNLFPKEFWQFFGIYEKRGDVVISFLAARSTWWLRQACVRRSPVKIFPVFMCFNFNDLYMFMSIFNEVIHDFP